MLQIANLEEYQESDIPKLLSIIRPILQKRIKLHERYSRGASEINTLFSDNNLSTAIPFEKLITDLATGYVSGKPVYSVDVSKDEKKNKIIKQYLNKDVLSDEDAEAMQILIKYIVDYNDDEQENKDLLHDLFELTACYEFVYENEYNELVYSKFDPLQTVATWDYSVPANLTGLIRTWSEVDINNKTVTKVQLIDKNSTRTFNVIGDSSTLVEIDESNLLWNDVPAFAVETDFSVFEMAEDIIKTYEQCIQNTRNTLQYNDSDAKLKIKGYSPQHRLLEQNSKGEWVQNEARLLEDKTILASKTFYVGENGDVDWILKPMNASGIAEMLKLYIDLIFQISGIPNTSDLAFNSADLNASAIDRKFYIMDMFTSKTISLLKKAYLRRFELIFNRINVKKSTKFDFRDINIDIPKNLPSNSNETADYLLKLDGKLSDKTILETLGFDYESEKEKIDAQSADNLQKNLENLRNLKNSSEDTEQEENLDEQME